MSEHLFTVCFQPRYAHTAPRHVSLYNAADWVYALNAPFLSESLRCIVGGEDLRLLTVSLLLSPISVHSLYSSFKSQAMDQVPSIGVTFGSALVGLLIGAVYVYLVWPRVVADDLLFSLDCMG